MPASAASIIAAERVAHGAIPHQIDYCCKFKRSVVVASDDAVWPPVLCPAQISRTSAYTGALAAAEYRRIVVREHSHLLSVLGAASTAAGRCISAGAPPQPPTCFRF